MSDDPRPVMYLDVGDTLLSMHRDHMPVGKKLPASTWRHYGYAPPGAHDFMVWALEHFEVRWLTWWCPWGEMHPEQAERLERELGLEAGSLSGVRSARFGAAVGNEHCHKTAGIAWEEHRAGRPFVWVEDWISEAERAVLRGNGFADCWIPCHVTDDPGALRRAHDALRGRFPHTASANPADPHPKCVVSPDREAA